MIGKEIRLSDPGYLLCGNSRITSTTPGLLRIFDSRKEDGRVG